jgi:hypothetical protein
MRKVHKQATFKLAASGGITGEQLKKYGHKPVLGTLYHVVFMQIVLSRYPSLERERKTEGGMCGIKVKKSKKKIKKGKKKSV